MPDTILYYENQRGIWFNYKWYSRIAKCMNACLLRILLWKVHSSNCVLCLAWNFCSSTHHFLRHPDTWLALKKLLNLEKVGMMMTSCFLFDSTVQSIILGAVPTNNHSNHSNHFHCVHWCGNCKVEGAWVSMKLCGYMAHLFLKDFTKILDFSKNLVKAFFPTLWAFRNGLHWI